MDKFSDFYDTGAYNRRLFLRFLTFLASLFLYNEYADSSTYIATTGESGYAVVRVVEALELEQKDEET